MTEINTVFIVTTMTKVEKDERFGGYAFGSSRSVGIFPSLEEAQRIVKNNVCDICETIYDFALIQEIEFGLYPTLVSQELYEVKDATVIGEDGKETYNFNLTYEPIPLPDDFQQHCITIG